MTSADNNRTLQPHDHEHWGGYTLDELRYRRAYVAAKRQIEKERLLYQVSVIRSGPLSIAAGVARKVAGSIPAINYVMLALTVGSSIWKLTRGLRKKKKK